jgi:hypothetical protein
MTVVIAYDLCPNSSATFVEKVALLVLTRGLRVDECGDYA